MSDILTAALGRLSRVPGVRGAMLVDAEAGVPVVAELAEGVEEVALAALAASVFHQTARAMATAGLGGVQTLQLEAGDGHVVVAGAGELIVVAVTAEDAQLGRVRLEAHRTAEGLL